MRLLFKLLLSCFFLFSCSNSAFVRTSKANETMSRMNKLQKGMSTNQVRSLLGCPRKIGDKVVYGQTYTVWYYVTQGVVFDQTEYYQVNFTPIVFSKGKLFGWGKAFYYNLFRSKNSTLGKRGGEKDDIYYFKTNKNAQPGDTKSLDEILEEIHEEKDFHPLDKEQIDKDQKKEELQKETQDNDRRQKKSPTSKKTKEKPASSKLKETDSKQQSKDTMPAPAWDEDEYLKDEDQNEDKRPVFWE